MKTTTWRYGAAGLVLVLLGVWAFMPSPLAVESGAVVRGPFESTIDEDGRTRLRERYTIAAPVSGRLSRITLKEGDEVAPDAVVAMLSPGLPPLLDGRTRSELKARLEATEAQVQRAEARIARAEVAVRQARDQLMRTEQLREKGFVAPAQLDNDQLSERAAQQEKKTALEDRHVALHEVAQARAALASVQDPGKQTALSFAVRSPVAGRVLRVLQQSEAVVPSGASLLEVGDTGQLEVCADLLTTDAVRIPPGAKVRIGAWGGQDALSGRVRLIEPSAFTKVSALGVEEQRVKVVIELVSPLKQRQGLGDGYRVGVQVVTLAVNDAVLVPVGAVFPLPGKDDSAQGGMGVFVLKDGRAHLTPITVTARNAHHAWVRQGLAPGDTVVQYPPTGLADGSRVTTRRP